MISKLKQMNIRPSVYEPSTKPFWDDNHISKGLLEAHLSEEVDAATRPIQIVNQTISFIDQYAKSKGYQSILDIGCGPGIYTTKLAKLGYDIVGIDFSKRSIEYAKQTNVDNQLNITYLYQDYLTLSCVEQYDLIILIYCDYGVLSSDNRTKLLNRIHQALKPGGSFMFDVFTPYQYQNKHESSSWYYSKEPSFWLDKPHLCLENHFAYDNQIRCDQYMILDEIDNIEIFRIWDQAFTTKSIKKELKKTGFENIILYSDLTGKLYQPKSKTMGIIASKKI
jgi:SAM-dependent methyltransferase